MSNIKNLEVNYDMLSDEKKHDLYLRKLATGEIQGPPTGKPSQDKPWLKYYSEEAIVSDVPSMSIYDYVKLNNKDNFEIKALNFFGLEVTYKTFFAKVDKVVECLKIIGVKEIPEMFQTNPVAPQNTRRRAKVLESNDNSVHRLIAKDDVKENHRQGNQVSTLVLLYILPQSRSKRGILLLQHTLSPCIKKEPLWERLLS